MLFLRQSIVLISTLASAFGRGSRGSMGGYGRSINRSSSSASEVSTIVAEKESNRNSTIPFVSLSFVQDTVAATPLSHSLSCPFLMVHSWRLRR